MKIFQIEYVKWGSTHFAYFLANTADGFDDNTKFYEDYMECKNQSEKYFNGFEHSKIREALKVKFGK